MKSKWKIAILALITLVVVVLGARHYFSNLRYIERITGVEIPPCEGGFQTYGYDFGISGFGRINPKSSTAFAAANNFEPCTHNPSESFYGGMFKNLPIQAEGFPPMKKLLTSVGNSEYNSWCFYFEPATRNLWVTVLHPDMAGDLPPGTTRITGPIGGEQ